LLREDNRDLRGLDLAAFRDWLDHHLARWRTDPVFVQRARIRDLRRAHRRLLLLEDAYRRAAAADLASPHGARLRRVEQALRNTDQAVAGLTAALRGATAAKGPALRQKLEAFQARRQALRDEQDQLLQASPARQALVQSHNELEQFRAAIGLDRAEALLDRLLQEHGRRSGHAGASFERLALTLTERYVVPDLLRRRPGVGAEPCVRVLRGVTLGAARTELDQVVVRPSRVGDLPVEVLAVVEVKRNVNDLAHGFGRRQENLAWLTGDTGRYDPAVYRTRHFRSGHFDREAVHQEQGEAFVFGRGSFRRFRRDAVTGWFLNRVYLVTRAGTLWGVSGAALARLGFRVATDERWAPDSEAYLRGLRRWCQALAEPIEAPDVLRAYAATPQRARQILVVGR
jgi:hypothetical protein